MAIHILNYLLEYLTYFIGGFIQSLFILLPVTLKNWEDDTLNSLTYISFQLFVAGIIFIIAPWILESKSLSIRVEIWLIVGTGLIATFRVIKLIPLEFTFPIKVRKMQAHDLNFDEFYTNERFAMLDSLDFQDYDALMRYNAFREKLLRVKIEKKESDSDEE